MVIQVNIRRWKWEQIAECLLRLKDSLEAPIESRGLSFKIPVDIEMGTTLSKRDMTEVTLDADTTIIRLARHLHDLYEQQ